MNSSEKQQRLDNKMQAIMEAAESLQPALAELAVATIDVYETLRPSALPKSKVNPQKAGVYWFEQSTETYDGKLVENTLFCNIGDAGQLVIRRYSGSDLDEPIWTFIHAFAYNDRIEQHTVVKRYGDHADVLYPLEIQEVLVDAFTQEPNGSATNQFEDHQQYIDTFAKALVVARILLQEDS
jgi:hypothetical protein